MLLLANLILLCMYGILILLYIYMPPPPTTRIPPWPLLPIVPESAAPVTVCHTDADCPVHHACLNGTCVRKLLRGGQCHPTTGQWISYTLQNVSFAICVCLDPQRTTQKFFGGDCDVHVACGVHGTYDPAHNTCICDPGYAVPSPSSLTCQKLPAIAYKNLSPCGMDEVPVERLTPQQFHPDYIAQRIVGTAQCVKRPCSFDALTGRPLKHARYEPDWGCVCDPRYGLFGVQLEGRNKRYLSSPGYDACASILQEDPKRPMSVQFLTYFYLNDRAPISIILFDSPPELPLTPLFSKQHEPSIMITQSLWRYDFAQRFFKDHVTFRIRSRTLALVNHFGGPMSFSERDRVYVPDFYPLFCDEVYRNRLLAYPFNIMKAYGMLYGHPVCKVHNFDKWAHPMYRERMILNPQHLTLDTYPDLAYFNAFVLKYDATHAWTLELDYPYNIDQYRSFATNAPDYDLRPAPVFP